MNLEERSTKKRSAVRVFPAPALQNLYFYFALVF